MQFFTVGWFSVEQIEKSNSFNNFGKIGNICVQVNTAVCNGMYGENLLNEETIERSF